jgi:hypothetical protein
VLSVDVIFVIFGAGCFRLASTASLCFLKPVLLLGVVQVVDGTLLLGAFPMAVASHIATRRLNWSEPFSRAQ